MSYLLTQILVCLLIAGLIGAVIGWFLRGGCSKKLRDCEDEWKMKVGSLESEWSTKLQRTEDSSDNLSNKELQAATLKRHAQHVETETPSYSYEEELKAQLEKAQNTKVDMSAATETVATGLAATAASALATKGISLSDDKVALYSEHGIDFDTDTHLDDDYDLQELAGLNHDHVQKLEMAGIKSTKDFTKLSEDAEASSKLAKSLDVDAQTVQSWIGKSCLLELPGVDSKTADFMQNAGISTEKLRTTAPEAIQQEMQVLNNDALIPVALPDIKSITLWSKVAKPVTATTKEEITPSAPMSYEDELREKLQIAKGDTSIGIPNNDNFDPSIFQGILANRGIKLSDEKIKLYSEQGIDFENATNLEDDYDVQTIEGIGPKYAQALKDMGIPNTQTLVTKLMKNHQRIDQIAKTLKIQPEALSSWISMADLVQLPGVDAQAAELMQTVGIESAKELAITNANSLHSEMVAFNKKSPIVPEVPSAESLGLWSKIAKLLG